MAEPINKSNPYAQLFNQQAPLPSDRFTGSRNKQTKTQPSAQDKTNPTQTLQKQGGGQAATEVCIPCRKDVVIPVVYPQMPITVPTKEIYDGFKKINSSLTDNEIDSIISDAFSLNSISIKSKNSTEMHLLNIGHAGVCFIDSKTEKAYYYEFGRYGGSTKGVVRKGKGFIDEPFSVSFQGEDPSQNSLVALYNKLRNTNPDKGSQNFEGIYVKVPQGKAQTMLSYCESVKGEGKRGEYSLKNNHCLTFALDVATKAGVSVSYSENGRMKLPQNFDERTTGGSWISGAKLWMAKDQLTMDIPIKIMRELQQKYKQTSHSPFKLEGGFPKNVYSKI